MSQYDVIAIGDTVTDCFIRLDPETTDLVSKNDHDYLLIPYGMKVPFKSATIIEGVGNAANAAVSCARLGLRSGLITNVGDDSYGSEIISTLRKNGVHTQFVKANHDKKSNYHFVLWHKEDRTILVNHIEYDYDFPRIYKKETPKWLYLTSLANHTENYHDEISEYLEDEPSIKLAFQPGTFQIKLGVDRLKKLYARAELLVVNLEEAQIIAGVNTQNAPKLLGLLHKLGAKIVVITDGHNGSAASDGNSIWHMPIYPDIAPPFERTGAGDAFTSTLLAALAHGASLEEALLWAPINSMNVVQHLGAQEGLLTTEQLNNYLRKAPKTYHPKKIK